MANEEKKLLNDEVLAGVSGGLLKASADEFTLRRDEFESAWKVLGLDDLNISGMRMAAAFDEWELTGFKTDAVTFLKNQSF